MNIYEKNLEALGKRHPDLVKLVESINIDKERIKVLPTESGDHRILYKKEDGEEIFIHNAEDPAKCANQAIDLLGKMEKEGIAVLFGFGLGYFAEEVLKRFEKGHVLMVYEATPEIFKTALETRDLSDLLSSEKVTIVLGDNADSFSFSQSHHHLLAYGKFWIVKHHPSVRLNNRAYEKFQKKMEEEKMLTGTGIVTVVGLGKEFINSFMEDIPHIIRRPGVIKLKDLFKGRPAIIVAAGPSLEKNIHLLKMVKGKAVIVAVDAVLPILLPAGIVPDILVAIDPLPDNVALFNGNPLLKHVPFVCLCQYTPKILNIYPGHVFVNMSVGNVIFRWLYGFWEDKGFIECFGGSVSHLAFSVAEHVGANVIAFVGQDLSFSENLHAGNVTEQLFSYATTDKEAAAFFNYTPETKMPDFRNGANEVKNIFGEKRYALGSFLTFKMSFERKIKSFKGAVIHATEDGLPIDGTKVMRLIDFIEEYCGLPEIDTFSTLSELADTNVSYNIEGLLAEVKRAKTLFVEIKKNGAKILKYIYKVRQLIDKGQKESAELHNVLDKIEILTEKVKHPMLDIIAAYHYKLELYLKRQEIQEIDELEDKWERLEKQLSRARNYYPDLAEAIDLFLKQLDKLINALERENKVNSILLDDSMPDYEKYCKIGKIYKRTEMVSQAVKYLELALDTVGRGQRQEAWDGSLNDLSGQSAVGKSSIQYPASSIQYPVSSIQNPAESLQIDLAEMYVKQFRFYEAKEMLKAVGSGQEAKDSWQLAVGSGQELKKSDPQPTISNPQPATPNPQLTTRITELLKICDEKITAWEERKKEMEKLVKNAEVNYGGHYESGNFYFRVKNYEQAEKAYLKAIREQEAVAEGSSSWQLAVGSWQHPASSIQHPVSSIQYPASSIQYPDSNDNEPNVDQSPIQNPKSAIVKAYYGLANTYLAMNKPEKCVDTLGKIIEIEPENPSPYCDLGHIAAQNNNLKDAENFLKKAIELAPNMEEPYKLLAGLYVNQGEAGKAASLYEKALSANPDNPTFTHTLAGIYKNMISAGNNSDL